MLNQGLVLQVIDGCWGGMDKAQSDPVCVLTVDWDLLAGGCFISTCECEEWGREKGFGR